MAEQQLAHLEFSNETGALQRAMMQVRADTMLEQPRTKAGLYNNPYVAVEELMRIANPILMKHGIWMLQAQSNNPVTPEMVMVETRLTHCESGQYLVNRMSMPVARDNAHAYLSCVTYLRRSMLCTLLNINLPTDDDDGTHGIVCDKCAKQCADAKHVKTSSKTSKPNGYATLLKELHEVSQRSADDAYDLLKRQPKATMLYFTKDQSEGALVAMLKEVQDKRKTTDAT